MDSSGDLRTFSRGRYFARMNAGESDLPPVPPPSPPHGLDDADVFGEQNAATEESESETESDDR